MSAVGEEKGVRSSAWMESGAGHGIALDRDGRPLAVHLAGSRIVGYWLFACAGMVFVMAIIGAITRLTESGLSMVEWRPLLGTLPPLSEAEWQRVFDLYRRIPEYQEVNRGMSLAEFKSIFWWEYIHRLWGRLIGLVYILPLAWFALRGLIRAAFVPRLLFLLALGAGQGVLGWVMVQSGFADRIDVSQYRLTAHLTLALAIFSLLLWSGLDVLRPSAVPLRGPGPSASYRDPIVARQARRGCWALIALLFLTVASGGLVAGLNAGFIYPEWPLMGGQFVPSDYWGTGPITLNAFESLAAVQFHHRWIAAGTALAVIAFASWCQRRSEVDEAARHGALAMGVMAGIQVALGIATVVLQVPIWLGAMHQAGAITLLGLTVFTAHALRDRQR